MLTRPEDAAKDLDLAALSTLAHMNHPEGPKIAAAVLQAIRDLPAGTRVSYDQLMRAVLGPIEEGERMLKPYRLYVPETIALVAEAEQRGRAEGEQRGEARGVALGEARGQLEGHRAGLRFGWAARFGAAPMPAAVEEALQAADLEAIRRAGPALLGAQDAEAAAAALLAALVGPVAG